MLRSFVFVITTEEEKPYLVYEKCYSDGDTFWYVDQEVDGIIDVQVDAIQITLVVIMANNKQKIIEFEVNALN